MSFPVECLRGRGSLSRTREGNQKGANLVYRRYLHLAWAPTPSTTRVQVPSSPKEANKHEAALNCSRAFAVTPRNYGISTSHSGDNSTPVRRF